MRIIYSYNKKGFEAEYWQREITAASDERHTFIPFNHDPYLDANLYLRAQLLDNLYYDRHPGLMRMYADLEALIGANGADALIVDNCFPYHPDYLKTVRAYKVLRTSDGPITAYDRDFAYVHAYDHVLYHSPAYSRDMGMAEKLRYVGARAFDFWPFALWDAWSYPSQTEESLFSRERDIEIIFIGYPYFGKLPLMAKVKKAFGKRLLMIGFKPKYNVYFNVKYGFPGYVRPPIRPGASSSAITGGRRSGSTSITGGSTRSGITGCSSSPRAASCKSRTAVNTWMNSSRSARRSWGTVTPTTLSTRCATTSLTTKKDAGSRGTASGAS